jgi:hypothetical protein
VDERFLNSLRKAASRLDENPAALLFENKNTESRGEAEKVWQNFVFFEGSFPFEFRVLFSDS